MSGDSQSERPRLFAGRGLSTLIRPFPGFHVTRYEAEKARAFSGEVFASSAKDARTDRADLLAEMPYGDAPAAGDYSAPKQWDY